MPADSQAFDDLTKELKPHRVILVAVSKTKPIEDIEALYALGQRDFGENYVQELVKKKTALPGDIRWHFIGHLQSNKVKLIIPFVQLIQGIDSLKLLQEVNKQAGKNGRTVNCLLQVHIAQEETKFGLDENELALVINEYGAGRLPNVKLSGLMGMASLTENMEQVRKEFRYLKQLFDRHSKEIQSFDILSMGMSADFKIAIEEGSNLVRIGSRLFGERSR